jgi:hypothetical protein
MRAPTLQKWYEEKAIGNGIVDINQLEAFHSERCQPECYRLGVKSIDSSAACTVSRTT